MQVKGTHGGVRHFIFVDLIMWPRNSLSSCNTIFTATYSIKLMLIKESCIQHKNDNIQGREKDEELFTALNLTFTCCCCDLRQIAFP